MTKIFTEQEKIIRRKAKRIERANNLLHQLLYDYTPYMEGNIRDCFEENVKFILEYLKNDDKEDNKWNYDNYNG